MKIKSIMLALALVLLPLLQTAHAQSQASNADSIAKIKSDIVKRVANKKTRVRIKLHDGSEVKGNIEQASDDGFTLTEDKTGKRLEMSYNSVEKVGGRGMSTLTKIGIVVGVVVVVVAVAAVVAIKNFDPFEGGITAR